MHLVALVEGPDHVCCRYRIAAYRPYFERAGHRLDIVSLPRHAWHWFAVCQAARAADLVILQRKLISRWQFALLRRVSRRLVYDFDDAVFQRDSYAAKSPHSARRSGRFSRIIQRVDAVVAGNSFLAESVSKLATPRRVHVIPTCVDPARYQLAQHNHRENTQLVWIGSKSTMNGLHLARPLLEKIGERVPGISLKLISDGSMEFRPLPVSFIPWSQAAEVAELAAADVGISWLPADSWSRGKCGLKVLQYMAAGLPVVANPVGVQAEMVRHGETGFLAETETEWIEAIRRLSADSECRRQMGAAGRRLVETRFSVEIGAARWLEMLDPERQRRRSA